MTSRRSFWRMLAGAPLAAVAVSATEVEKPPVVTTPKSDVEWTGDSLSSDIDVLDILASHRGEIPTSGPDFEDAMAFYAGDQWPKEIQRKRQQMARPALVVNRIPELVSRAYNASNGKYLAYRDQLIYVLVLRNRDAQRMYNYMASAKVEAEMRPKFQTGAA